MNSLLTWLATFAANWLLKKIKAEAQAALEQHREDEARGKANEENLRKYNAAKTEEEEIQAALDLLNRRRK